MFAPKQKSPKKKPFVSTAKRNTTFGTPPPLPPLAPIERDKDPFCEELIDITDIDLSHGEEGGSNPLINFAQFQEMSIRWVNMTTTLWSMIVGNSRRKFVRQSLHNFVTALYWRLNGAISEEEFHCLYQEWTKRRTDAHKSQRCDVFVLRDCLLEQSTTEDDLEIFLGIIIFETNKEVINSPLSYQTPHAMNLELCSSRWLSLSEELFFLLDNPGYGFLGFDDLIFLTLCLLSGSETWKSETELDARISLTNVTAVTAQLMREAGSDVSLDSTLAFASRAGQEQISPEKETIKASSRRLSVTYDGNGHRVLPESPFGAASPMESRLRALELNAPPPPTPPVAAVGIVTLPMFKRLLIKKSVGEGSLVALVAYLKECTQRLVAISEEKAVDVLSTACISESVDGADISAPKLWTTCIEEIFGYAPTTELPTILLYLMTDACLHLPLAYLAFPSDESEGILTLRDDQTIEVRSSPPGLQHQDLPLLDSMTLCLWNLFLSWGAGGEEGSDLPQTDPRDSVYQLISCVLSEYKSSLQLLCAAFIDIAMDTHDHCSHAVSHSSSGLQTAVNLLLPEPREYMGLLEVVLKAANCTASQQDHSHPHDRAGQSEVWTDSPIFVPESALQSVEGNHSDWHVTFMDEISNAVWATVFDVKDQVRYPGPFARSPTTQSSPNRTINFVERRRKRRSQRGAGAEGAFSQSNDSQQSFQSSPEAVRLEFDGHSSRNRDDGDAEKAMVGSPCILLLATDTLRFLATVLSST
jgi:hypothetical protein